MYLKLLLLDFTNKSAQKEKMKYCCQVRSRRYSLFRKKICFLGQHIDGLGVYVDHHCAASTYPDDQWIAKKNLIEEPSAPHVED